jgi:hypothetical protein
LGGKQKGGSDNDSNLQKDVKKKVYGGVEAFKKEKNLNFFYGIPSSGASC